MSRGTISPVSRYAAVALMVLLVLSLVALCVTACGGSDEPTETSAVATTDTTVGSTATTEAAVTETTEAVTETTTAGPEPVLLLGKQDFGAEVSLKVGERGRVELEPWVGDQVRDIRYEFNSICAKEVDSGVEAIEGIVISGWMEFEAVVAGPCSIRAFYELPDGTAAAKWVVYVRVQ